MVKDNSEQSKVRTWKLVQRGPNTVLTDGEQVFHLDSRLEDFVNALEQRAARYKEALEKLDTYLDSVMGLASVVEKRQPDIDWWEQNIGYWEALITRPRKLVSDALTEVEKEGGKDGAG